MDDAFKRLEELVAVPAKKKRVYKPLTPEQKARKSDTSRKWRAENREKVLEHDRKWRAENPEKALEASRKWHAENREKEREANRKWNAENQEKVREASRKWRSENLEKERETKRNNQERKAADPELFAISQAEQYARRGNVTRDITARCPEPTRSKLQALVDQIKADPSAGKQVIGLLRNMRELRKLELAEIKQATETETEN